MIDFSTIPARKAFAQTYASKYLLDPALLCAQIEQESSWEPGQVRFEPGFLARYILPMNLEMFDSFNRSTSWGLTQIIGQTAIEFGFSGDIPSLRDPDIGTDFGCKKLRKCLDLHPSDLNAALLAYNGGGDPDYPAKVLARQSKYL